MKFELVVCNKIEIEKKKKKTRLGRAPYFWPSSAHLPAHLTLALHGMPDLMSRAPALDVTLSRGPSPPASPLRNRDLPFTVWRAHAVSRLPPKTEHRGERNELRFLRARLH
jgi:hypothetical protein